MGDFDKNQFACWIDDFFIAKGIPREPNSVETRSYFYLYSDFGGIGMQLTIQYESSPKDTLFVSLGHTIPSFSYIFSYKWLE